MTDNLRDRIIAAIAKADQDWCSDNNLHEDMADAVIAELGLTREWSIGDDEAGRVLWGEGEDEPLSLPPDQEIQCRYTTEWEREE